MDKIWTVDMGPVIKDMFGTAKVSKGARSNIDSRHCSPAG